jgi:hypothetical protein
MRELYAANDPHLHTQLAPYSSSWQCACCRPKTSSNSSYPQHKVFRHVAKRHAAFVRAAPAGAKASAGDEHALEEYQEHGMHMAETRKTMQGKSGVLYVPL